jgi:hypothetical protein
MMFATLKDFYSALWNDYCAFNPQARRIHDLLTQRGETIENDHIALRTFKHPRLGIQHLARAFEHFGYKPVQEYIFKEKKLYAKHWEHPDSTQPKVFISELETEKLSSPAQKIIDGLIAQIPETFLKRDDVAMAGRPWTVSYNDFETLANESEYAAWLSSHGFRPNHFTVFFNSLKGFKSLVDLNTFLRSQGYEINESGGEVKGTPAELLEQSSTMAENVEVQFNEGIRSVPACYYEFAKRYPHPQTGKLYHGFIAASADKIFESTNRVK